MSRGWEGLRGAGCLSEGLGMDTVSVQGGLWEVGVGCFETRLRCGGLHRPSQAILPGFPVEPAVKGT